MILNLPPALGKVTALTFKKCVSVVKADQPDALWVQEQANTPVLPLCEASTAVFHPGGSVCILASCSETAKTRKTTLIRFISLWISQF